MPDISVERSCCKKACRLDQRTQIYMNFKSALNYLLHSKQRDPHEANRRPKKKKNFYWKISFREKHFAVSITKEGRHKFSRDFEMNTTEQNEKAYTKEFWLKQNVGFYMYIVQRKRTILLVHSTFCF